MPSRPVVTSLDASTVDIINTIRANASAEYQSLVPQITTANEIPRVGEVLYGYPALANQFIASLVNRIALVKINSATFNNMYKELKKGYLEFGETVEEVFVNIAKAREFSAEKAEARELKRSIPDVRSAFHAINWRVQYPITIQNEDLRMAFQSAQGVQDLIAKIVDSVYRAAEYDEFLLFKYLLIKNIAHGKMYPVAVGSTLKNAAAAFRGTSNKLEFMSNKYNSYGVTTNTKRADQYIFMDANYNAEFDVEVLASAFNMDKADFMGRLMLIDDFTTFDNERFSEIMSGSDMIETVTSDELALMAKVKAVLVDREWFQIYDNLNVMTEKYVAAGIYWNYFYNVWKIVSSSPFSNAIVFVDDSTNIIAQPSSYAFLVDSISASDNAIVYNLIPKDATNGLSVGYADYEFVQDGTNTASGIAIHRYGSIICPVSESLTKTGALKLTINGVGYTCSGGIQIVDDNVTPKAATAVGDTLTFSKDV